MTTDLVVFGDTHVPSRETEIPEWVQERVRSADHVVHTGDFDAPETATEVRDLAPELTAVAGNVDPPGIDFPDVATTTVEDVTFVVVHGTGPHESWPERVAELVHEAVGGDAAGGIERGHDGDGTSVVGVAGHTHTPTDTTVEGLRLLNPGTATGADPGTRATLMSVRVDGDTIDVELQEG